MKYFRRQLGMPWTLKGTGTWVLENWIKQKSLASTKKRKMKYFSVQKWQKRGETYYARHNDRNPKERKTKNWVAQQHSEPG